MSLTCTTGRILRQARIQHVIIRCSAAKPAEAVFITRELEVPVICVTEDKNVDLIGPPDPVSKLRPIVRRIVANETVLQQKLRQLQDETQDWNQKFWSEHNTKFIQEKKEYVNKTFKLSDDQQTITADEMSEFYKAFLDKNWKKHVNYNFEWYKRNFTLLYLAFRVYVQGLRGHL